MASHSDYIYSYVRDVIWERSSETDHTALGERGLFLFAKNGSLTLTCKMHGWVRKYRIYSAIRWSFPLSRMTIYSRTSVARTLMARLPQLF